MNELFRLIAKLTDSSLKPTHRETRPGDIRDSLANISKAKEFLGYEPTIRAEEGLKRTFAWFRTSGVNTK